MKSCILLTYITRGRESGSFICRTTTFSIYRVSNTTIVIWRHFTRSSLALYLEHRDDSGINLLLQVKRANIWFLKCCFDCRSICLLNLWFLFSVLQECCNTHLLPNNHYSSTTIIFRTTPEIQPTRLPHLNALISSLCNFQKWQISFAGSHFMQMICFYTNPV